MELGRTCRLPSALDSAEPERHAEAVTEAMAPSEIERWRRNLQGEVDGALIYRAMARKAGDDRLAELYTRMAESEDRHAALWRGRLEGAGARSRTVDPTVRARILAWLARTGGAGLVAPIVAGQERSARTMYDHQPEAAGTSLPAEKRSHARLLGAITGGTSGSVLARFEGR